MMQKKHEMSVCLSIVLSEKTTTTTTTDNEQHVVHASSSSLDNRNVSISSALKNQFNFYNCCVNVYNQPVALQTLIITH